MTELANLSHILLNIVLVLTVLGVAYASYQIMYAKKMSSSLLEYTNTFISLAYIFVSGVLLYAFYACEFSYEYVYGYSDSTLPLFYRLTAFWGGQPGSLLFWALSVVLCGLYFQFTKAYKSLSAETRAWYLIFFFIGIAFLTLLLTTHNDPFALFPENMTPTEGFGLNPLLQHPGMIFHPPLLLLGYGGFTIPACLALAQAMSSSNDKTLWHVATMPLTLLAWLLLSAGIILGAWWAYMELGWGGYWAWDPVENASLIPWFFGTAALHIGFLNAYRGKAGRVHTLIMGLTYVSAFFATWLVRGNVVDSVHAFGGSGLGGILGSYVLLTALGVCGVCLMMPKKEGKQIGGAETREGLAVTTVILLLTISVIIMIATLWPAISVLPSKITGEMGTPAQGIGVPFYNSVILPLLTVIIAIMAFCPWVTWSGKIVDKKYFLIMVGIFIAFMVACWTFFDIKIPLALLGVTASLTCAISWALFCFQQGFNKVSPTLVHIGFALMGFGVAMSGPYQINQDLALKRGESIDIAGFNVTLNEIYMVPVYNTATLVISKGGKSDTVKVAHNQPLKIGDYLIEITDILDNRQGSHGRDIDLLVTMIKDDQASINDSFSTQMIMQVPVTIADFTVTVVDKELNRYSFIEAELLVKKDGAEHGTMHPQRRRYATHPNNIYSEAVTIASFGDEIYATFSGVDDKERARLNILIQPMVNWIWIGGTIMSIAPFFSLLGLSNRRRKEEEN